MKPKAQFLQSKPTRETEPEQNSSTGGESCFCLWPNSHLMSDALCSFCDCPGVKLTGQEPARCPGSGVTCSGSRRRTAPFGSTCRWWRICCWPNHGRTGTCFPPDTRPASSTCGEARVRAGTAAAGAAYFGLFSQNRRGWKSPPNPWSPSCVRCPCCPQSRALHGHFQGWGLRTSRAAPAIIRAPFQ